MNPNLHDVALTYAARIVADAVSRGMVKDKNAETDLVYAWAKEVETAMKEARRQTVLEATQIAEDYRRRAEQSVRETGEMSLNLLAGAGHQIRNEIRELLK